MNRYEKFCGVLTLIFASAVVAIGQAPAPNVLTPTPDQQKDLKIALDERIIHLQAAQLSYANYMSEQQKYQESNGVVQMTAAKIKADNKWDPATQFNIDNGTFTAPAKDAPKKP